MKVLHVSTYGSKGGAGRAAVRLNAGLLSLGVDSKLLAKCADAQAEPLFAGKRSFIEKIMGYGLHYRSMFQRKHAGLAPSAQFSGDASRFRFSFGKMFWDCDVIHLHWVVDDFFDYKGFFSSVPANTPVVWTLHDMNPFTGGCHYDAECGRYREKCGACPMLNQPQASQIATPGTAADCSQQTADPSREISHKEHREHKGEYDRQEDVSPASNLQPVTCNLVENDLSRRIWERKDRAIRGALARGVKLRIVTPSKWLADCAEQSSLFRDLPVSVIPYGVDTSVYKPYDGTGVREAFGVLPHEHMVLFVSQSLTDERKGFRLLLDAMRELPRDCAVKLVGVGYAPVGVQACKGLSVTFTGEVQSDAIMAMLYSAADVFVIPSLQDNLPNTVLESMACGTPVVGFDVGGIPDMVRPSITGLLAPVGDTGYFANSIREICANDMLRSEFTQSCRKVATEEYSLLAQAKAYEKLYSCKL